MFRRVPHSLIVIVLILVTLFSFRYLSTPRHTRLGLSTFQITSGHSHTKMADMSECPFCTIAKNYSPSTSQVPEKPDPELITPNCHLILSTPTVMAFLDILPIAMGHVLVIPREHREKLKDLDTSQGAALGAWLPIVSRATMRALGRAEGDWNIVQNNGARPRPYYPRYRILTSSFSGAAAAQVVPHVHYHIIPRGGNVPDLKARSWTMFGRGQREELDDEDGVKIAAAIRKELKQALKEMEGQDAEGTKLLAKL